MKRILIITNRMADNAQDAVLVAFTEALNARSSLAHYDFCTIQDLVFELRMDGSTAVNYRGQELAKVYDAVHLRNLQKYSDYANALRLYAQRTDLHLVNPADSTVPYHGKLSQGFLFAENGVPTPPLISSASNSMLSQAVSDSGYTYPMVIKHNDGIKGLDNYRVKDEVEMRTVLRQEKQHFLAQPFIANDGELRVLTFGKKLKPLVFKKQAVAGSYLNNTSQGGNTEQVDVNILDPRLLDDAQRAAELTGRDIGGVDVLLATDGKWYVLEVNSTPQIATGAYTDDKLALYDAYFTNGGTQ